jgi:hypothetical protein
MVSSPTRFLSGKSFFKSIRLLFCGRVKSISKSGLSLGFLFAFNLFYTIKYFNNKHFFKLKSIDLNRNKGRKVNSSIPLSDVGKKPIG